MGSSQSTETSNVTQEQLVQQYRSLRMQEDHDQAYVHVEKEDSGSSYLNGPSLTVEAAKEWERRLLANPKNKLALAALTKNNIKSIVEQDFATLADQQVYNLSIPFEGAPVTNQRQSGRCWLFATTNVLRVAIMKKHNLKEFELSQSYLFFWDKLEKSNWFLTQIIDTADEDLSSRVVQQLLSDPVGDGGQWDMASNLVKKYGLVPQKLYPDAYSAKSSGVMDHVLTTKLREDALQLRSLAKSEKTSAHALQEAKAAMLKEIHTIITLNLGPPPKPDQKFKWEYYDAHGKFHSVSKTPLEFADELSTSSSVRLLNANVKEMFSLVNDPRHEYRTHLTVSRLGNVVEGRPISYVNVDMTTMKQAAIAMIKAGLPVWFGSDVGQSSNGQGIMDPKVYDYSLAFNITLGMNKAQRLQTKESAMTHAMVLTAVHIENGKPVRWRVMNSWGENAGEKGYFVMTDAWMDEFCYQIITDPSHVPTEISDVLKQKPLVLPLWDPMGTLA